MTHRDIDETHITFAERLPVHCLVESGHGYSWTACDILFRFWDPIRLPDPDIRFECVMLIATPAPTEPALSWTWNKSKTTCAKCLAVLDGGPA